MRKLSTKLKPSLLQQLSEEGMHRLDCSQTEIDLTISEDPWPLTKPSTTLFPKSVKNQMDLNETSHQVSQTVKMTLMDLQTKNAESLSPRCPGTTVKRKPDAMEAQNAKSHVESSNSLPTISRLSDSGFKPRKLHHSDFQLQSGITSSKVKPLTSTQCSHHCTIFLLLKRTLDAWDRLKYPLVDLSQPKRSK